MAEEFGSSEAISAFIGASLAFAVDWVRAKQDRHREEADSANRALLALAQMYGNLQNLWNQFYAEPLATASAAGRQVVPPEVRASAPMPDEAIALDVPSLSFLLRGRDADLPNRIAVVVATFRQLLLTEATRAQLHLEMQTRLESLHIDLQAGATIGQIREACGPKLWAQLVATTKEQLESIPKAIADILKIQQQALDVLKFEFPSRQFVKFQPRELAPGENIPAVVLPAPALWRRIVRGYYDWLRRPPAKTIARNT